MILDFPITLGMKKRLECRKREEQDEVWANIFDDLYWRGISQSRITDLLPIEEGA